MNPSEVNQKRGEVDKMSTEQKKDIALREDGTVNLTSMNELWRYAQIMIQSGTVPKGYNKPEQVIIAVQFLRDFGIKTPFSSLAKVAVVNGTPAMFGDLPLGVVLSSGMIEWIDEYLFDKEFNKICIANKNLNAEFAGAVCIVKRKGMPNPVERTFTVEDAKKAGIWNQNVWAKYPKYMIKYRARSSLLKDIFADVLNGAAIGEYDFNMVPDEIDIGQANVETPKPVDKLNELLLDKKPEVEAEQIPVEPTVEPQPEVQEEPKQDSFDNFKG